MRNPRRLHNPQALLSALPLDSTEPRADSVFWQWWQDGGQIIAEQALATPFVQGIGKGTLPPVQYGAFAISDLYYCVRGEQDYGLAAERCQHSVLAALLRHKQQSYQQYNQQALTQWRLANAKAVQPSAVARRYATFERAVARGKRARFREPIYTLAMMIPCEWLWAWLAMQLMSPSPSPSAVKAANLYQQWLTDNADPSGAYAMANFIDQYRQQHPVDNSALHEVYIQAMEFELQNFASAFN